MLLALRRSGEDFRALDGLQLSSLTPYLGVTLGGWRQLAQERARAAIEQGLCGNLGAGWILFATSGRVSAMAEGLAAQLNDLSGIKLCEGGWLALPEPEAQALRQALAALARPGAGPQHLTLSRAPLVQLVLTAEELAGEPALLGRLRHDLSARALPLTRLTAGLGLSRSEARLAACLCDGLSLAAAASELGWTLETGRSCSKQLFARLGVSGQPGVVRRVLASGVWLG
ncbi:helix-turn-helix transcriptional regulator [Salipiger sp. CCB-MM3]|uniref:helix-turn-helix transcriptional regulator n=1 Tax=Salipiger sp. CCB-MM3 TaxID=1792508 RepID=UPI0012F7DE2B|nr:hypothetical protein [Salipiger sp. CCB-MM3]